MLQYAIVKNRDLLFVHGDKNHTKNFIKFKYRVVLEEFPTEFPYEIKDGSYLVRADVTGEPGPGVRTEVIFDSEFEVRVIHHPKVEKEKVEVYKYGTTTLTEAQKDGFLSFLGKHFQKTTEKSETDTQEITTHTFSLKDDTWTSINQSMIDAYVIKAATILREKTPITGVSEDNYRAKNLNPAVDLYKNTGAKVTPEELETEQADVAAKVDLVEATMEPLFYTENLDDTDVDALFVSLQDRIDFINS